MKMDMVTENRWLKILLVFSILTHLVMVALWRDANDASLAISMNAVTAWESQKETIDACEAERDLLRENVMNLIEQGSARVVTKLEPLEPLPEDCWGK